MIFPKNFAPSLNPRHSRLFRVLISLLILLAVLITITTVYYHLGKFNHTVQPSTTGNTTIAAKITNDPFNTGPAQSTNNNASSSSNQSTSGNTNSTNPATNSTQGGSKTSPKGSSSTGQSTGSSSNPAAPTPSPTPPAYTPHPLFVGDFETGTFNQWAICQTVSFNDRCTNYSGSRVTYSLTLQNTVVRQGNWAARFEVRNGDQPFCCGERSEVNGDTALTSKEGDERWYQWSTQFASGWPNQGWAAVAQWHDEADGPPAVSFNASTDDGFAAGNWGLMIHKNSSPNNTITTYTPWQTSLNVGNWHDIKVHVKWSTNDSIGFIELWRNGIRQTFSAAPCAGQTRCTIRTMTPGGGGSVYYKQGYYRSPSYTVTGIVYQDGFSMAANEADLHPL